MIKYRKNENWGIKSFEIKNLENIEDYIREKLKSEKDVDIVDVQINKLEKEYIVTVFFAREEND